jgi:hypothetical protein
MESPAVAAHPLRADFRLRNELRDSGNLKS